MLLSTGEGDMTILDRFFRPRRDAEAEREESAVVSERETREQRARLRHEEREREVLRMRLDEMNRLLDLRRRMEEEK